MTAALARGPLNQKASYVQENVPFSTHGTTSLHLAQSLPSDYTAVQQNSRTASYLTAMLEPVFSEITNEYSTRSPINSTYTTCGESCSVQGMVSIETIDKVSSSLTVSRALVSI